MQATRTTRPARRIPAARLARVRAAAEAKAAAREQAWQDAQAQRENPTPEFTAVPRLTLLPGGLHWSAQGKQPAIGATVQVQDKGEVQVKGYCHAAGFLGLVVEPKAPTMKVSHRSQKAQPARARCVFGSQLVPAIMWVA